MNFAEAAAGVNFAEEDWRRRCEKRLSAVASIKASVEYQHAARRRVGDQAAVPGTPDGMDRLI